MSLEPTETRGWTTYDPLLGPTLDEELWRPLSLGLPRLEQSAMTTVGDGTVTVDVSRFTNGDLSNQLLDNTKYVIHSTNTFRLPRDGIARFAADIAVSHVGGDTDDYRRGFAAFNVLDREGGTHMVFNVLATRRHVYAEHEVLALPGESNPFTRVVHDAFVPIPETQGFRTCCIEIDTPARRVTWSVDGRELHEARGLEVLPETVALGFGFFTLLPVRLGEDSCGIAGAKASWRNFRYEKVRGLR